jgi:hypothetical protein
MKTRSKSRKAIQKTLEQFYLAMKDHGYSVEDCLDLWEKRQWKTFKACWIPHATGKCRMKGNQIRQSAIAELEEKITNYLQPEVSQELFRD